MKLVRFVVYAACLGASLAQSAVAGPAGWWDDGWEVRIPITVEAAGGALAQRPIVLRWDRIANGSGIPRVRLSSLRLVSEGGLAPFQVDHRDHEARLLAPGDLTLDPQDELVFLAPSGRRTEFCLYASANPKPPATFPSDIQARELRRGHAQWTLSTADLAISVQGTGMLDLSANTRANHGRGAVVGLRWKGVLANWQGHNWGVVMNAHPFPTGPEDRWGAVKLLVDGPVRKVIAFNCPDSTAKDKDGAVILRADVTRSFAMFAGLPLYDVEDVVHCLATQGDWTAGYVDKFHAGRAPDVNDTLWDGSSGDPRTSPLAGQDIPLNEGGRFAETGTLVTTEKIVHGWYGWFDEKERTGLAAFYGVAQDGDVPAPAAIRFGAGWEMWSMANRMTFVYRGLEAPVTLRHRFRVIGLGDVSPETVVQEYRLWSADTMDLVTIGEVETR